MSVKASVLAVIAVATIAGTAQADGLSPSITPANGVPLDPGQLYAVETTCTAGAVLPDPTNASGWRNLFPTNKKAMTFYVSVQSTPVSGAPVLSDQLKSSLLVAYSFAFDQTKQQLIDNRAGGSCNQSILVYGQTNLYVVPVVAAGNQFTAGAVVTAFDDVLKAATSLAPVFGAAVTGGAIKSLGDVNGAVAPIQDLVGQFDPTNSTIQAQSLALTVGNTTVATPYGTINVAVRPIVSVLNDRHAGYRVQLRAAATGAVTGAGNTIDVTADDKLRTTCELVASKVSPSGFTSSLDADYAIIHAAAPSISSKDQMATCLGLARAKEAAGFAEVVMYEGVPLSDRITLTQIHPSFADISGRMDLLTQQLGRYVKLPAPQPRLAASIQKNVSAGIWLDDPLVLFDVDPPKGAPAAIDFLRAKGYQHIGFFAQVTNTMPAFQEYNVVVGFVAIKAPADNSTGCYADALALYPHFTPDLAIDEISVSSNREEIKAIVGTRGAGGDNGFTLTDCPATPVPSVASPVAHGGRR